MMELVELCRLDTAEKWSIVSNPRFDSSLGEAIAAQLMRNSANKYVEYKNCGVIYRVIRKEDLKEYFD